MKRVLTALAVLLPAATALAAVRPVSASATAPFGSFGLTVTAAAIRTEGVVGASGGLVTLDAGAASTTGRLDGGPSSYVQAAPVEPGTLARTLVGTANTQAGTTVLTVQDAESSYPGRGSARTEYLPAQSAGPLTVTPGLATSSAEAHQATASTTGTALSVAGAGDATRLSASSSLTGDIARGAGVADAVSRVGNLEVAGVLVLRDVTGTARVDVTGGHPVVQASLTVDSAAVAGVPVTIDEQGVHVTGQGTGLGPVADAQEQVDQALSASGVSVRAVGVTKSVEGRSGYADTGGLTITVKTPDLPAGVAGNSLTLTVAKVSVTGTSTAALPSLDTALPPLPTGAAPVPPTTSTTTVTTGDASAPSAAGTNPPAPVLAGSREVLVAGRQMPAAAALAAFGVWQLLTLSTATLYALVDRRRRLEEQP